MPEEIAPSTDGGGEVDPPQPQTPAPQQVGPPPGQPAKVVSMPTHAVGKLKEEAFAKGQAAAMQAFAQQAGFNSPEEMAQALGQLKRTPSPAARTAPANEEGDPPVTPKEIAESKDARRIEARYQRQLEGVTGERNRFQQQLQAQTAQAKAAKEESEALRAEMYLRTVAAQLGVQDIDYAITLFSRAVENLSPEDADKFDERGFFTELRKSKPLLFGETTVPANTGTSPGNTPGAPPKPGTVTQQVANGTKPDIRNMKPAEFQAELRKRGINSVGA